MFIGSADCALWLVFYKQYTIAPRKRSKWSVPNQWLTAPLLLASQDIKFSLICRNESTDNKSESQCGKNMASAGRRLLNVLRLVEKSKTVEIVSDA